MRRMELLIGEVLSIGLLLSVLIVLIGGIFYLIQNANLLIHYQVFQQESNTVLSFSQWWNQKNDFPAQSIILLGFFILVLTQVIRVILTAFMFLIRREYIFTVISLFILGVLLYSLFWRT